MLGTSQDRIELGRHQRHLEDGKVGEQAFTQVRPTRPGRRTVGRCRWVGSVRLAMIVDLLTELLIFGWAAWRYGFVPQRFRGAPLLVGQGFQSTLGLGLSRQDAFDRLGGIGAVADGTFQGGEPVFPRVTAQQPQHAPGLILTAAPSAQEAIEEATGRRTQFVETLPQQG